MTSVVVIALVARLATISGALSEKVTAISRFSQGERFSDVTACSMTRSFDWGESLRLAAALAGERPVTIDRTRPTLLPLFWAEGKASRAKCGRLLFTAERPEKPLRRATPSNYFLRRDPGAGFAP